MPFQSTGVTRHLVSPPPLQLWETAKVHTTSAVCLKRDSDVLFSDGDISVAAADNRNRLQVRRTSVYDRRMPRRRADGCVCVCVGVREKYTADRCASSI